MNSGFVSNFGVSVVICFEWLVEMLDDGTNPTAVGLVMISDAGLSGFCSSFLTVVMKESPVFGIPLICSVGLLLKLNVGFGSSILVGTGGVSASFVLTWNLNTGVVVSGLNDNAGTVATAFLGASSTGAEASSTGAEASTMESSSSMMMISLSTSAGVSAGADADAGVDFSALLADTGPLLIVSVGFCSISAFCNSFGVVLISVVLMILRSLLAVLLIFGCSVVTEGISSSPQRFDKLIAPPV